MVLGRSRSPEVMRQIGLSARMATVGKDGRASDRNVGRFARTDDGVDELGTTEDVDRGI